MSRRDPTKPAEPVAYSSKTSGNDIFAADRTTTEISGPTDSHVLSKVDQDDKGLAQKAGQTDTVTDLGWNQHADELDEQLVSGISNEDLWMLIRRFNKVLLLRLPLRAPGTDLSTANLLRESSAGPSPATTGPQPGRR